MIKWKKSNYPDGGAYADILDVGEFPHTLIHPINNYEDLFMLASIKDGLLDKDIEDVELIIPCMWQQQHDRRFKPGQSFELKLVCNFINDLGFKKVYVFHPHSDSTEMGIKNFKRLDNANFILKVLEDIKTNYDSTPMLLSTDGGSYKWINKLASTIKFNEEVYGASKARAYDPTINEHKLIQVIDRQDFKGEDVLVVDDLSVFGGTFLGLSKMLKERNVGKIFLAVSHITVPNPNIALDMAYERIYCTNSKYDSYELKNLTIFNWKMCLNSLNI